MANTKSEGSIRLLVWKEREGWYSACLEFGIVDEPRQDRELAWYSIMSAVKEYLEAVAKEGLSDSNLNRSVDPDIELKWEQSRGKNLRNVYSSEMPRFSLAGFTLPRKYRRQLCQA